MLMCKRNNPEISSLFDKNNRIGKAFHKNSPGADERGKVDDWRCGMWRVNKTLHTFANCGPECTTKARELPLVPILCLDEFLFRFVENDEALTHSRRRSRRSRTSDQGRPFPSPFRTRSTRLSI